MKTVPRGRQGFVLSAVFVYIFPEESDSIGQYQP